LPPGVVLPGVPQGGRTTAQGYGTYDGIRQQFTSKERDNESGLDYFGARYYSSAQGRFTSVDPENAGADPGDPQSWNSYAYARNNPLKFTDPDGRKIKICDNEGRCSEISDADANKYTFNNEYARTHGFAVSGNKIFDSQGNQVGTWVRTSFDDLNDFANGVIFGSGNTAGLHQRLAPVQKVARVELAIISAFSVPVVEVGPIGTISIAATQETATVGTTAAVEQGVNYVMNNPAKVSHIFANTEHNLQPLASRLGGQENTVRAVLNALSGKLPSIGRFERVVNIGGQPVVVRGSVVNGVPKIGTMFVK